MLLRQLEYFVALAQERHFARAANACYVSQPALSEAIRKLEHELNVPLVRRGRKFEGLTPEGERLVPWARRILADRDALKQQVAALQTGLIGELRLAWADALQLPLCLLTQGMRGRRVIDDALATQGLQVRPRLETDSVVALLAHVRTGRWASVVPQPWIHTLGTPAGVSVLRLERPAVTALIALVTNRAEPGSLLARALRQTARNAGIAELLDGPDLP